MAERRRTRAAEAPVSCEVAWLRRRGELEDMPTRRIRAQAETSRAVEECGCRSGCLAELAALAEEQNKLLCDILGAINCLTAARLATEAKND